MSMLLWNKNNNPRYVCKALVMSASNWVPWQPDTPWHHGWHLSDYQLAFVLKGSNWEAIRIRDLQGVS